LTPLVVASVSRAEDAAYRALTDVASAWQDRDDYLVIGGLMVALHAARHPGLNLPQRGTQDLDVGMEPRVLVQQPMVDQLRRAGYELLEGNRLGREVDDLECYVDVLTPAYQGRPRHNVAVGALVVDEVAGLQYAMGRPREQMDLRITLTNGQVLQVAPPIPDVVGAIVLKVLAFDARGASKDAVDVWRLLEVALADGLTATAWPSTVTPTEVAVLLRRDFVTANGRGLRSATSLPEDQVRIRLLARQLVG
jgi:hypothetical protein